jgi:ribose transport system permease protein
MTTMDTAPPAAARPREVRNNVSAVTQVAGWPATRALLAVVLLFLISPLVASGSVSSTAMSATLPFAALTALVAIGQTLVIQQGGLDLSVPGAVTLGSLIVAKYGHDGSWGLPTAVVVAILGTSLAGLLSGLVVAWVRLPPLVVTIAINGLLTGVVYSVSGGFGAQSAASLSTFALRKAAGIPILALLAALVMIVAQVVLKLTRPGRRFELVGENPRAAAIAGIGTTRHIVVAYWLSSLLAAAAGVLLAGLLRSPTLTSGDSYLLPSIAAVVLGGTALTGGRGSLVGSALGALFLVQLNQLVQTFTSQTAVQNIVQALIIGIGIVVQLQVGGVRTRLAGLVRRQAR